MAANTAPIFPRIPKNAWGGVAINAANTTKDLTSGTIYLVYTADAVEGGRVDFIRFLSLGTNVATVARVWMNNGALTTTAANNTLIANRTLPATTNSEVAQLLEQQIDLDMSLEPGHRLYVTIGTAVAAGYHATAFGGSY